MRYFADLHIHSRYARACSKDLTLPVLDATARQKGITVLGTGDFTHPFWFGEIKQELAPAPEAGLFWRKGAEPDTATRFILTSEISSIYTQGGRSRRVHTIVCLPSLEAVALFNDRLGRRANLRSDGRPIVGVSAKDIAHLALEVDPMALVIPAHAWTPWFAVFGSMSGFDSLEECFEELSPHIYAIETGLSSDPAMNWRVSALDNVALMSSSDAHSPAKLAREATEFDGEVSYLGMLGAFKQGAPRRSGSAKAATKLVGTVEFFPEEGKYHYDGHRFCKVSFSPEETQAHKGLCPVCRRPLTIGVMNRLTQLADRTKGTKPAGAPGYRSLVPLAEVIAETVGTKVGSKAVKQLYERLVNVFDNELKVLIEVPLDEIVSASNPLVGEALRRMRSGKLQIAPGYDGEYGVVKIFSDEELAAGLGAAQESLF